MAMKQLAEGLYIMPGMVNIYMLETRDGLAVIDTGFPGRTGKILAALREIGKSPSDVKHIILTHCHPDHMGSAAALKHATGAMVWAHPLDVPMMETGTTMRQPMCASPGLRNRILAKLLAGRVAQVEPVKVDGLIEDGMSPPFAPDLIAIHIPGHCEGQLAFLWNRHGGILFPADACVNRGGLMLPVGTEDPKMALASLDRLATLKFEMVCVMHGKPILRGGDAQFRRTNFDTFKTGKA